MKSKLVYCFVVVVLTILNSQLATVFAQGSAFTYQGRLNDASGPANGSYNVQFTLYSSSSGGLLVVGPLTNNAVAVSNGLFSTSVDFGTGYFTGVDRWLEIAVQTNGASSFAALTPRQHLTPTPYAIFANTASNLSGTISVAKLAGLVNNGQLASSSITVTAGTGLAGGGVVALGGSTTLNNAGVLSVAGNPDISASTVSGAVTLGSSATTANIPNTIVKRDGSGSFSAGSVTLNTSLYLPATTSTSGIIYAAGLPLIQSYGAGNFFGGSGAGNLTLTGSNDTGVGTGALANSTTGSQNTAGGYFALNANTGGSDNTAFGGQSLSRNITGSYNTAVGSLAMFNNTNSGNTAYGYASLYSNTSGNGNVGVGQMSLYANSVGYYNTAVGTYALYANTNSGNTGIGYLSLYYNTSGSYNTANGFYSLLFSTNGSYNTALGAEALLADTSGSFNTAVGDSALHSVSTGYNNIGLGYFAGYNLTMGNYNIDIGNPGVAGESATIRIGAFGAQTNTFIAGVINGNGAGLTNLNASQLGSGTIPLSQLPGAVITNNASSVTLNGTFGGNGAGLLNVNAALVGGLAASNFWQTSGNAGTGGNAVLGTTDNQPLDVITYNQRGLRLQYGSDSSFPIISWSESGVNVIGGYAGNYIPNSVVGGTIAGGGDSYYSLFLGGTDYTNTVNGSFGTVGGGYSNTAGVSGTVPGGYNNTATGVGSFAAGANAHATNSHSFVWSDGTSTYSSANNSFDIEASGGIHIQGHDIYFQPGNDLNYGIGYRSTFAGISINGPVIYSYYGGALAGLGPDTIALKWDYNGNIWVSNNCSVGTLTIRGGADLAEPFNITAGDGEVPEGSVVVIDEQNPGHLKVSDSPYDTHVAGVVSGANGINPGIQMHQQGLMEGGKNVALTGRVYVQADVSNGKIKPGDMLTTSGMPGRAMRVSDHARAAGAILGKAMTALNDGRGMVLVLVTLQ